MRTSPWWKARSVLVMALAVLLAVWVAGCQDLQSDGPAETGIVTTAGISTTVSTWPFETTTSEWDTVTTGPPPPTSVLPPTTTLPPTSVVPPPPTTATTASGSSGLSSAETLLPNGNIKGMGYIVDVYEYGERHIRIDYAEMLTGAEAQQAAIDAGDLEPGEDLPNDYYIRNVNPLVRDFVVSNAVTITTATRSGGFDQPATWAEFVSWWGYSPAPGTTHLHAMPWWIVRDGESGVVVKIDEQYIP